MCFKHVKERKYYHGRTLANENEGISEKWHPGTKAFGGTRDPRPGTQLIGGTRDPRLGILKAEPET